MLSVEEIKEHYKSLEDAQIENLAKDPNGLRKEAVPILINEIKRRNLDIELIQWVTYETNAFEGYEKEQIIGQIINSKCSVCKVNSNLKGYTFNTKISALITIINETKYQIICSECARKMRTRSMLITLFLGWWSVKGFLSTPFILISDLIKIFRAESESEEIINKIIENNTGVLRMFKDGKANMDDILEVFNNYDSEDYSSLD